MHRASEFLLLVLSMSLALGCAREAPHAPTVDVVVASDDLPAGTTLELTNVSKRAVPSALVSPSWILSERAAEVMKQTTLVALSKGDPILKGTLAVSAQSAPSAQLDEGTRFAWVEIITPVPLTETVRAGDHVDLIAAMKDPATNELRTSAPLEDALVIAVRAKAVGLQLAPRDANRLALLSELAFVRLSVRRPGDAQRADAGFVDVKSLAP